MARKTLESKIANREKKMAAVRMVAAAENRTLN